VAIVRVRTRSAAARAVRDEIRRRLASPALGSLLVSFAERRVFDKGDSEHRYPDLWDDPRSYRAGEQPLLDTAAMIGSLRGEYAASPNGGTWALAVPENQKHALYHQTGFETEGPNFIPLTREAGRRHRKGRNPEDEGLVEGTDYIMAWGGVSVPERRIFNWPDEDRADFEYGIRRLITGEL
jgi:hypothetical protein